MTNKLYILLKNLIISSLFNLLNTKRQPTALLQPAALIINYALIFVLMRHLLHARGADTIRSDKRKLWFRPFAICFRALVIFLRFRLHR